MEALIELAWGVGAFWVTAMVAASLMEARLMGPVSAMSLVLVSVGKALNRDDYMMHEREAAKKVAYCFMFFASAASWFLEPQYRNFLGVLWYGLFLGFAIEMVFTRQVLWLSALASAVLVLLGAILPFYWWTAPDTWQYGPFVWFVVVGVKWYEDELKEFGREMLLSGEEWLQDH